MTWGGTGDPTSEANGCVYCIASRFQMGCCAQCPEYLVIGMQLDAVLNHFST